MKLFLSALLENTYKAIRDKQFREYLKLLLLYGGKQRYKKTSISFLNYKIDVNDCRSFLPQFREIFVQEDYKFDTNSVNPLILDCGANVGTSVIYFKSIFPSSKIIAYEADPIIYKTLDENIKRNNFTDVQPVNSAVWINDEGVDIASEGADAGSIVVESDNKTKVNSFRLKDELEKHDVIDMLKIDIEGAEVEVLKDCKDSLNNVKNLFVEYHSFKGSEQELAELLSILTNVGFRYIINHGFQKKIPFINYQTTNNVNMDLLLNIYAINEKR